MPMQRGKSPINLNQSLKSHARDETDYGQDFSRLPGGITGGIAQLVDAKIGTYKTGELTGQKFCRLAGVVIEPGSVMEVVKALITDEKGNPVLKAGKPSTKVVSQKERDVRGLQTSIIIPLCDSGSKEKPVSADENVADMLNTLRTLGGQEFTEDIESEEDLVAKLAALKEAAPYFRFGTNTPDPTVQYPTPRTFERWYGSKGLENYVSENGQTVQDDTAQAPAAKQETATAGEPAPGSEDELDQLVVAAMGSGEDDPGDGDAQAKLQEMATELGISKKDIDKAADWEAVGELIKAAQSADPTVLNKERAPEDAEFEPSVGEIYSIKILDPKKKKKVKTEVEIMTINKKAKTLTVRRNDTKAQIKDVKFDDLESAE